MPHQTNEEVLESIELCTSNLFASELPLVLSAGNVEVQNIENLAGKIDYLAGPYTSGTGNHTPEERHEGIMNAWHALYGRNCYSVSPVLHCAPIAQVFDFSHHATFWGQFNRQLLRCCGRVIIVALEGWADSDGVAKEIKWARSYDIPMRVLGARIASQTKDRTFYWPHLMTLPAARNYPSIAHWPL